MIIVIFLLNIFGIITTFSAENVVIIPGPQLQRVMIGNYINDQRADDNGIIIPERLYSRKLCFLGTWLLVLGAFTQCFYQIDRNERTYFFWISMMLWGSTAFPFGASIYYICR